MTGMLIGVGVTALTALGFGPPDAPAGQPQERLLALEDGVFLWLWEDGTVISWPEGEFRP